MIVDFLKSRCLICWKEFEVPKNSSHSNIESFYFDRTRNLFSYYYWVENSDVHRTVSYILSLDIKLQNKNDDTKGNTALQIVGLLSDGNQEAIIGFNRCPRCGFKLNFISSKKIFPKEINALSFNEFHKLEREEARKLVYKRWTNYYGQQPQPIT